MKSTDKEQVTVNSDPLSSTLFPDGITQEGGTTQGSGNTVLNEDEIPLTNVHEELDQADQGQTNCPDSGIKIQRRKRRPPPTFAASFPESTREELPRKRTMHSYQLGFPQLWLQKVQQKMDKVGLPRTGFPSAETIPGPFVSNVTYLKKFN